MHLRRMCISLLLLLNGVFRVYLLNLVGLLFGLNPLLSDLCSILLSYILTSGSFSKIAFVIILLIKEKPCDTFVSGQDEEQTSWKLGTGRHHLT